MRWPTPTTSTTPTTGSEIGRFALNNFSNPLELICNAITAVADATAAETGKLCAQTLGPTLKTVGFNELPVPVDPFLMKSVNPDRLIYSEPALAPGGAGPKTRCARDPSISFGIHRHRSGRPRSTARGGTWPVRTRSPPCRSVACAVSLARRCQ